jgi:hypothetical protein
VRHLDAAVHRDFPSPSIGRLVHWGDAFDFVGV